MSEELRFDDPEQSGQPDLQPRDLLPEISRTMVKIYKEQFGRGPVKSRSDWAGDDILVCTLEDTLTPAEKKMVEMGEHQRLRDVRMFFQYATIKDFIGPVERITGRTVRSFVSGMDTHADLATEVFVFYPVGSEGPSRMEKADL
jgi:uncharacterized protein YbcI